MVLGETLEHLQASLETEKPPENVALQELYSAVGVELPGVVLRRFDEVRGFYQSIIQNRRAHLEEEITHARMRLSEGERTLTLLDRERSEIFRTLQGHGALEDFVSAAGDAR